MMSFVQRRAISASAPARSAWLELALAALTLLPLALVALPAGAQTADAPAVDAAALGAGDLANSIVRIDANQTGSGTVLTIQLKAPAASAPGSFSINNPPRIALDLPQTGNSLGRGAIDINQGELRSVNVVQAQGRSRVVLNLRKPQNYTVNVEGNLVQVTLGAAPESPTFPATPTAAEAAPAVPAATATAQATPAPAAAAPMAAAPAGRSLRAIDFRRGSEGEGRVIIDLSEPNTTVDIRQQGNSVVVDFKGTTLPEGLRRRLDVTDFGTPVAQINALSLGGNARVVIEPRGAWEQTAYQSDNRLVVEVRPVKSDPTRLFPNSHQGYQGERLSLNFQNVDVRALLQVIADFTNLNIITSDSVQGSLTLRLKDVPWDQALDIILQSKGLDMRKNGNVILVAPRDELATKEKLELEAKSQISDLEPLRTESFTINYQKADDVRGLLVGDKQRLLSKRGSVVVDVRTNQMFVQDTPSHLEEVRALLQKIDIPVPQVMIEARIVEAQDSFSSDLGARFGVSRLKAAGNSDGFFVGSGASSGSGLTQGTTAATGATNSITFGTGTTATTWSNPNFVNLPAGSLNGFNAGSIGLTLFNASLSSLLNLEVSALELDGLGKIISSPRVITADKVKASIEQGTDIPYQSASSAGGIGQIQFRKAVMRLEVTPQITPDGAIFLDVKVNKDSPSALVNGGAAGNVAIDTKAVQTQVLVENGGTVVLGGIYQLTETTTVTQVPLLGDIPVVGNLFKNTAKQNNRTELLIFITPRVLSERLSSAAVH